MTIQERIINSRNQLGLNQTQLAELAGITAPTVSQYESGKRKPTSKVLFNLAKALQVSPDYLLNGQESNEFTLGDEDKELLALYKTLSPQEKKSVMDFLKYMATKDN